MENDSKHDSDRKRKRDDEDDHYNKQRKLNSGNKEKKHKDKKHDKKKDKYKDRDEKRSDRDEKKDRDGKREKEDKVEVKKENREEKRSDKEEKKKDEKVEVKKESLDGHKKITISEKDESVPLNKFRISEKTIKTLESNKIDTLFPIQARAFDYVYDGRDLIGRARTGTGKTLSFSLPIIERMLQNKISKKDKGPIMVALAPTRELAKQVESVIQSICQDLVSVCIYGGVPYSTQENYLYRGVDIIVGTPGRIIDFLRKGTINFRELKFFILDEADEMLNMGFREDIEEIMGCIPKENKYQTLLYSATIPEWVKKVADTVLQPDFVIVDLIGADDVQTAVTVKHLAIMTTHKGRLDALADVVGVYSKGGKTMIFCDTKSSANELALSSSISASCQVLHGDIAQKQREVTLKSFREGIFKILVATDVAARGLDINDVDLIIQCSPPKDHENYIHRSGRTGRAGKSGVSLTFYTRYEEGYIKNIERNAGIQFQRVGMPQAQDIYRISAEKALDDISKVSDDMYKHFVKYAKRCIEDHGGDSERALASALAVVGGHLKTVTGRSLLSSLEGYTAVLCKPSRGRIHSKVSVIRTVTDDLKHYNQGENRNFKEIKLTKDGNAIIDMPSDLAEYLIKNNSKYNSYYTYSIISELPELQDDEQRRDNFRDRDSYGSGGGGFRDTRSWGSRDNNSDRDNSNGSRRSYNDFNNTRQRNDQRSGFRGRGRGGFR